jgi:hypothetical protein
MRDESRGTAFFNDTATTEIYTDRTKSFVALSEPGQMTTEHSLWHIPMELERPLATNPVAATEYDHRPAAGLRAAVIAPDRTLLA